MSANAVQPIAADDQMTGNDVRWIRDQYKLTPPQLAELIGASPSSVYRWESAGRSVVAIDPFQKRLLALLLQQLAARYGANRGELVRAISSGMTVGGGLLGLYHLLGAAFAKSPPGPPSVRGRRRPRANKTKGQSQ